MATMTNAGGSVRGCAAENEESLKRVLRLEKIVGEGKFNRYEAEKESLDLAASHSFEFPIEVKDDCCLRFSVGVKTECENYRLAVKIDGATAFDGALSGDSDASFLVSLGKGEKTLSAELSAAEEFTVSRIFVSTEGCVDYVDREYCLSVVNGETESTIAFANGDELLVKRYIGGDLQTKICLKGVKNGVVCKLAGFYAVFYVTADGELKSGLYDSDFAYVKGCTLDTAVASACAMSGNPATVLAVKGNRVYKYKLDDDLNLVTQTTEWSAWRVSCEPSVSSYFIATDHNGNSKIIRNI